jgi:pyruvate dehydrogenase E2 component (dihydrolipoamide acetyltransferase)
MPHAVFMPRPGQMTEECTVLEWHKEEGEAVRRGDVLFEIETDKAVMGVEAFDEGVLLRRLVAAGETVPVNTVCAYIGEEGEQVPDAPPAGVAAPAAASVAGSEAIAAPEADQPYATAAADRPHLSPRARRLAMEAGVDPGLVAGSGPSGRIVERDVRSAMKLATPAAALPSADASPEALVADRDGVEPQPLSRMRRVIADRMALSAGTAPQFTVTVAVDATRLLALRRKLKERGSSITVTDFLAMATARSLVEMPLVNSRTDGISVWLRRRVHLGLAVAVPDGLVVVVLRDADHLTLEEVHDRSATMADAARAGKLSPDDMTGSTFSISNLGMYRVEHFTAIINPGESAILAIGSAIPMPVVIGEGIGIRSIMRLTLTADHRLIDGELAARFLDDLRRRLEEPGPLAARRLD